MKKVLMTALLVAVCAGFAMAQAPILEPVNVQVAVTGRWEINLPTTSVDFGTMANGDNATRVVTATIITNQKVKWGLQLNKNQDLTNSVAGETIPSPNFTYTGSGGLNASSWVNGQFPASATTVYTAAASEYKNLPSGTTLTTLYDLTIPGDAAAGTYTNIITYTLTTLP